MLVNNEHFEAREITSKKAKRKPKRHNNFILSLFLLVLCFLFSFTYRTRQCKAWISEKFEARVTMNFFQDFHVTANRILRAVSTVGYFIVNSQTRASTMNVLETSWDGLEGNQETCSNDLHREKRSDGKRMPGKSVLDLRDVANRNLFKSDLMN